MQSYAPFELSDNDLLKLLEAIDSLDIKEFSPKTFLAEAKKDAANESDKTKVMVLNNRYIVTHSLLSSFYNEIKGKKQQISAVAEFSFYFRSHYFHLLPHIISYESIL